MTEEHAGLTPQAKSRAQAFFASNAISSLLSSGALLSSRVGGVALTLFYTLLIARRMPTAEVGIVATLTSTMTFAAFLATLNFGSGALRYLVHAMATGDKPTAKGFMTVGIRLLLIGGPIAAVAHLAIIHFTKPSIPLSAALIASVSVPILASVIYFARTASQVGFPTRSQLANLSIRPLALLIIVGGLSLALHLDVTIVVAAQLASCVVAWLAQKVLLSNGKGLPKIEGPADTSQAGKWVMSGFLLSPRLLIEQYLPDFVMMAAAAAVSHSEVGVLMVVMRISNMIRFAVVSVEMAITPKLARFDARNDHVQRDRMLTMASHMRFWPVVAVAAVTFVLAPYILRVFGPAYVAGADALRFSLITPVALAMFGPAHVLLVVRGHMKLVGALAAISLAVLYASIQWGGHMWGLEGVAGATSLTMVGMFFAFNISLRLLTGLDASVFGALARRFKRVAP